MTKNIPIINSSKKKKIKTQYGFSFFPQSKVVSRVNQSERDWVKKKRIIQTHFAFCSNFTVANSLTLSSDRWGEVEWKSFFKKPYIINSVRSQNRWIHFWLYHYQMRLLFFVGCLVCMFSFRDEAATNLFHLWIPFGVAKSVAAFAAWVFICISVMSLFLVILMYLSWVQTILPFIFRAAQKVCHLFGHLNSVAWWCSAMAFIWKITPIYNLDLNQISFTHKKD